MLVLITYFPDCCILLQTQRQTLTVQLMKELVKRNQQTVLGLTGEDCVVDRHTADVAFLKVMVFLWRVLQDDLLHLIMVNARGWGRWWWRGWLFLVVRDMVWVVFLQHVQTLDTMGFTISGTCNMIEGCD